MGADAADRKLTTILAADVVGYSAMMATDEESTLATLKKYRELTDALVAKHGGRIFNTAGDAFLAEFNSVVEAVRCAISIQEDLSVRNSQLPEAVQMWFRIGVNIGDVMVENQDLFGDGVNVAARLEGLAEKGGICISGSTFEQVKNKLSIGFVDIGTQAVKNIPDPVQAFKIVKGNVSIDPTNAAQAAEVRRVGRKGSRYVIALLALSVGALAVAAGWKFFHAPRDLQPSYAFDGRWKVTVNSISGCLNNDTRAYGVAVVFGKIDEPLQPLPKKGYVSDKGEFRIDVFDKLGNLRAYKSGVIVGNKGEGLFQGKKPSCRGNVTLDRM